MDHERELRRACSTLRILGRGVIIFGIWSMIKTVVSAILLTPADTFQKMTESSGFSPVAVRILFMMIIVLIMLIDLIPRLLIGRAAQLEGSGKPRGVGYVILAVLLFAFWVGIDINELLNFPTSAKQGLSYADTAVNILIDMTSTVILGELCYTAIRVKKLKRGEG